jgi:hypothetical protein
MQEDAPWFITYWCQENNWTDPVWVEDPMSIFGGRWWAFPPLAVMAVPIDPFGLDPTLKIFDQTLSDFEQKMDQALFEIETTIDPMIAQFESTISDWVEAWGLDDLFGDKD